MSRAKTLAQRLREDPIFKAMYDDVVRVQKAWPAALLVAHRDENTAGVTFHLHVRERDLGKLRQLLGDVKVTPMRDQGLTTFHFHGRRRDMDRLLRAVAR